MILVKRASRAGRRRIACVSLLLGASAIFAGPRDVRLAANDSSQLSGGSRGQAWRPRMVSGVVPLESELNHSIDDAIVAASDILYPSPFYSVSGVRYVDDWAFISIVGLSILDDAVGWRLADSDYWTLVVANHEPGGWNAAIRGTLEYQSLMSSVPEELLGNEERARLTDSSNAPTSLAAVASTSFQFPFPTGVKINYSQGPHDPGFSSWGASDWVAVDLWSDGKSGNAPNMVYAPTNETIQQVCNDGTSIAIMTQDFLYLHFSPGNLALITGKSFSTGQAMGSLATGTFSNKCGYANQTSGTFHLHWGFPNQLLTADDWSLDPSVGSSAPWVKGNDNVSPGDWIFISRIPEWLDSAISLLQD